MDATELKSALMKTEHWTEAPSVDLIASTHSSFSYRVSPSIDPNMESMRLTLLMPTCGQDHKRSYAALNWLRNNAKDANQPFHLLHLDATGHEVLIRPYVVGIDGSRRLSQQDGVSVVSRALGELARQFSQHSTKTHGYLPSPSGFLPVEATMGRERLYRARQSHRVAMAGQVDLGVLSKQLIELIENEEESVPSPTTLVHGGLAPHQLIFSEEPSDSVVQVLGWSGAFFGDPIENWAHVLFSPDSALLGFVKGFGADAIQDALTDNGPTRLRLALALHVLKQAAGLARHQDAHLSRRLNYCTNMAQCVLREDWATSRLESALRGATPPPSQAAPSPTKNPSDVASALRRLALFPRSSPFDALLLCGALAADLQELPHLATPLLHQAANSGTPQASAENEPAAKDWATLSHELHRLYTDTETDSYQGLTLYWLTRSTTEAHQLVLPNGTLQGLLESLKAIVLFDQQLSEQWRQGSKKNRSLSLFFNGIQSLAAAHALADWAEEDGLDPKAWRKLARRIEAKLRAAATHLEFTLMLLQGMELDIPAAKKKLSQKTVLRKLELALPVVIHSLDCLKDRVEALAPAEVYFQIAAPH